MKRRPFRILIKILSMIIIGKSRRPVRRHFTAHFDRDNVATRQISLQNMYSRLVEMAEVLCAFHRVLFSTENQSYYNGQSEEREIRLRANESFKKKNLYIYTNCLKRGKTRTTKPRVVLVLYLIGERVARVFWTNHRAK